MQSLPVLLSSWRTQTRGIALSRVQCPSYMFFASCVAPFGVRNFLRTRCFAIGVLRSNLRYRDSSSVLAGLLHASAALPCGNFCCLLCTFSYMNKSGSLFLLPYIAFVDLFYYKASLYEERRGRASAASGTHKGRKPKLDKQVEEDLIVEV